MIHYSVDITFRENFIRVATKRIVANFSQDECNSGVALPYLPLVVSIDPIEAETDIEGGSPVPSLKLAISDPSRKYMDILSSANPEEALVVVRMLDFKDGRIETLMSARGYMTDVEWKEGNISMTVRGEEKVEDLDGFPIYSFDSFQYFEVLTPSDLNIGVDLDINDSTPWRVFKPEFRRTAIGGMELNITSGTYYSYLAPALGLSNTLSLNLKIEGPRPGFDYIKLATKTNSWTKYNITTEDLDSGFLDEVPGDETYLKPTDLVLFFQPSAGEYGYAIVGNAETGTQEVIAYTHVLKNQIKPTLSSSSSNVYVSGDWFYLSGIPLSPSFSTAFGDEAYDPAGKFATRAEKLAFAEEYGIKFHHRSGEIIAPLAAFDRLWINAGTLVPRYEDDFDLSVGLIWTGRSVKLGNEISLESDPDGLTGRSFKIFSRYRIVSHHEDIYDDVNKTGVIPNVLCLEIHNRPLSPNHIVALSQREMLQAEISSEISMDTKIAIARMNYKVDHIDISLNSFDFPLYNAIKEIVDAGGQPENLYNRYRGKRVDTIKSFTDMNVQLSNNQTSGTSYEATDIEGQNAALVNNATESFAVVVKSEFIVKEEDGILYERLYFQKTPGVSYPYSLYRKGDGLAIRRTGFVFDPDVYLDDTANNEYILPSPDGQLTWSNYLTYWPTIGEATSYAQEGTFETLSGIWKDLSEFYFLSQRYRVIHDAVPENSQDLGRMYPIVYGRVFRVPLIQAISRKTMLEDQMTAGDDYYIYASHACNVKEPYSITLEWFPDQGPIAGVPNEELFDPVIKREIVISPFPTKLEGHFEMELAPEGTAPEGTYEMVLKGTLYNPYHKLESLDDLNGVRTYGVRLRGAEWDSRAGRYDKRYAIRNGLGSTKLYATFSGYEDINGEVIHHPVDIIKHYVSTYGRLPASEEIVDEVNFAKVRSLTPFYTASVFLDEPKSVADLITEMSEQFGYMMFHYNGRVQLAVPSVEAVQLDKPLAHGYNLIEDVTEDTGGYKDIYTRIEYKYEKNWVTDRFDKQIILHPGNNRYCAEAAKANGSKKTLKIEADFVRSPHVAKDVTERYARILSGYRKKYKCKARYIDGILFAPGDVIPMTYRDFNMVNHKVLVTKVEFNRYYMELELLSIQGVTDVFGV